MVVAEPGSWCDRPIGSRFHGHEPIPAGSVLEATHLRGANHAKDHRTLDPKPEKGPVQGTLPEPRTMVKLCCIGSW